MVQEIIDTGLIQGGGGCKKEAKVIFRGDQWWTRRVIGVSTCPSMFNEGIWDTQKKTLEGSASSRTMEVDEGALPNARLMKQLLEHVFCRAF